MTSIPVADITAFTRASSPDERNAAAKTFADAVRLHGCAAITGHGLEEDTLRDAFAMAKKLFDLPYSDKMKAPHPDSFRPHRGYLAKSVESSGKLGAVYSQTEQEKEFLRNTLDWKVCAEARLRIAVVMLTAHRKRTISVMRTTRRRRTFGFPRRRFPDSSRT